MRKSRRVGEGMLRARFRRGRMRWRMLGLFAVATMGWGCPEIYGMDGSIDDAIEKDMHAGLETRDDYVCPSKEEVKRRCVDPKSEKCPQKCR